ncbi:hypothetical protein CTI12_AA600890 [Artemisia annua]|uniref:Uncharacterized protein n=1 Tax=Artemisia annua TaxID=35608 RepID=A0A2U1KHT1_ARTAN|nr:hypothetical protein CTI12_AA600890 [Artemisia annua]
MTSSTIYTAFFLFLMVIGAKLIVSQEECSETHSLLGCTEDDCMDLCREKYRTSLSFKKQNTRRSRGIDLPDIGNPEPEHGESTSTWGECKNIFRCRCHFECPSDE